MRFKLLLLFIPILIICGCSEKQNVSPILRGISFETDISYYNEKYVCECVVDSGGKLTMKFKYPEDLADLKVFYEKGKANIEYMGLTYTPNNGMPAGSVVQTLGDIFSVIEKEGGAVVKDGENCLLDGRYNGTYFKLYFTPSGLPLSVLVPDDSFKIQFNNLTILN